MLSFGKGCLNHSINITLELWEDCKTALAADDYAKLGYQLSYFTLFLIFFINFVSYHYSMKC